MQEDPDDLAPPQSEVIHQSQIDILPITPQPAPPISPQPSPASGSGLKHKRSISESDKLVFLFSLFLFL